MGPHVYSRRKAPTYRQLLAGANVAAEAVRQIHGRDYEVLQLSKLEVGGGCIMDWVYEELHVPFSYPVELPPQIPQGLSLLWAFIRKAKQVLTVSFDQLDQQKKEIATAYQSGFALPEDQVAGVGEEM